MSDLRLIASRVVLEWLSPQVASTILNGERAVDWADEFPSPGETKAAKWVLDSGNDIANAPFLTYLVRESATGLLIGGAGFHGQPKERSIELGYGLSPEFWGRGYATEACDALVRAAFASGAVDQVLAVTDVDNVRSKSVLKRAGFSPTNESETLWCVRMSLGHDLGA